MAIVEPVNIDHWKIRRFGTVSGRSTKWIVIFILRFKMVLMEKFFAYKLQTAVKLAIWLDLVLSMVGLVMGILKEIFQSEYIGWVINTRPFTGDFARDANYILGMLRVYTIYIYRSSLDETERNWIGCIFSSLIELSPIPVSIGPAISCIAMALLLLYGVYKVSV